MYDRHLVPALAWSRVEKTDARTVAVAVMGIVIPVLVGLATGKPGTGFTIGLGAMLLAGEGATAAAGPRPSQLSAILPALLAVVAATLIADWSMRDVATVALPAFAALLSGYSRPLAVGAIRFLVYFVLCLSLLGASGADHAVAALLFGVGALWNLIVRAMLSSREPGIDQAEARTPSPAQRRAHFRRTFTTFAGWQFPLRVAAGLTAALGIRNLWPDHHFAWVVLTVALLTQRPLESFPIKVTQRVLGTIIGVATTWAILAANPPPAVLGLIICLLAVAAPFARAGNYLAWAMVSSPAILLVMDIGHPIDLALLADRLLATLAGAMIVVSLNSVAGIAIWRSAKPAATPTP